jgi:hypothetical protein
MLAMKPKHSTWYKTESQDARNRPRNLALSPGKPTLDREDAAKALELLLTFESSYVFLFKLSTIKLPRMVRFETRIRHFYRSERSVGSVGQLIKIAMLRVKNALPFLKC